MLNALYETELTEMVTRTVPMVGLVLTMWLIYRLEWMAKELKKSKSTQSGATDLSEKPEPTASEA